MTDNHQKADCATRKKISQRYKLLHPRQVGLEQAEYLAFNRFRKFVKFFYHSIMGTICPIGMIAMTALYIKNGIYESNPFWASLGNIMISLWICLETGSNYSLLLSFALVARYVQLKHRQTSQRLILAYDALTAKKNSQTMEKDQKSQDFFLFSDQHKILNLQYKKAARQYNSVYRELEEYNRFWSFYLTNVFAFYILILSFVVYVVLFTTTTWYLNICYSLVFVNHAINMGAVIDVCRRIVQQNDRLATKCAFFTAKLNCLGKQQKIPVVQLIKVKITIFVFNVFKI